MEGKCGVRCTIKKSHPSFCTLTITIPQKMVAALYHHALHSQKKTIAAHGFRQKEIPLEYVDSSYRSTIIEHLKQFLFNYIVISALYDGIRTHKLSVGGNPQLIKAHVAPHEDGTFCFEATIIDSLFTRPWKQYHFKAPRRKNYKDLDKQAENFIKEEQKNTASYGAQTSVAVDDWVCFDIKIVDEAHSPLFGQYTEHLWIKIGNEEPDLILQKEFVGKRAGESFFSQNESFQEYFSDSLSTDYWFEITIVDILPNAYFALDDFKRHFKLKSIKDMHTKLIEVFSYRNDISQRRLTFEEALVTLTKKFPFDPPQHLVLRQQQHILNSIQNNPDYQVYKTQNDFENKIRQLATKQAKETIIVDQLAYCEDIDITHEDIRCYLNLTKRPRTKEFLYFDLLDDKHQSHQVPIPTSVLHHHCLREKTLNHAIFHLARTV